MERKDEQVKEKQNDSNISKDAAKKESKFLGFLKDNIPVLVVLIISLGINYGLNVVLSWPLWILAVSIGVAVVIWVVSILIITLFKVRKEHKNTEMRFESIYSKTEEKMINITDDLAQKIGEHINELNQGANSINSSIKKLKVDINLLEYILDTEELTTLEGSVGKSTSTEMNIYVQSSKFILEQNDSAFKEMICDNLRNGVVYHYLIPEHKDITSYRDFYFMLNDWFMELSKFLYDKENYEATKEMLQNENSYWDDEFSSIFNDAKAYWNNSKNKPSINELYSKLFIYFTNRLKVYVADESTFYTTTAAYEVQPNQWKAIIKLPSSNTAQNYYSFNVYGDRCVSDGDDFIRMFKGTFSKPFLLLPEVWNKVIDKITKNELTKNIKISYKKKEVKVNA